MEKPPVNCHSVSIWQVRGSTNPMCPNSIPDGPSPCRSNPPSNLWNVAACPPPPEMQRANFGPTSCLWIIRKKYQKCCFVLKMNPVEKKSVGHKIPSAYACQV